MFLMLLGGEALQLYNTCSFRVISCSTLTAHEIYWKPQISEKTDMINMILLLPSLGMYIFFFAYKLYYCIKSEKEKRLLLNFNPLHFQKLRPGFMLS